MFFIAKLTNCKNLVAAILLAANLPVAVKAGPIVARDYDENTDSDMDNYYDYDGSADGADSGEYYYYPTEDWSLQPENENYYQDNGNYDQDSQYGQDSQGYSQGSGSATRSNTSDGTSEDFAAEMVALHNDRRARHQNTGPLEWDAAVAVSAQDYANQYSCSGGLVHSQNPKYGENLAVGYDNQGTIEAWYDSEIGMYDYGNPVFGHSTGHFTQMVWKETTHVGCARVQCGDYYGQYTICQYYPPGNMEGAFSNNVMPLN